MKTTKNIAVAALIFTTVFSAANASATSCFRDDFTHNASAIGDSSSWAIATQQARHTYDDWIWRGPVFKCPSNGTNNCTYAWGETRTSGYSWSAGVSINGADLPIVGSFLTLIHVDGSYGRDSSFSTSYTWSVNMQPGYYAQPIQVVTRRWWSGHFQGMNVNTGGECAWGGGADVAPGHYYSWDGNRTYGYWSANKEVSKYATYYIHR